MTNPTRPSRNFFLAEIGIVALIGCGLALANLFNPEGMALGARMAYWIGGLLAAWALFGLFGQAGKATARFIGIDATWGYVLAIPIVCVIISWAVLWWLGGSQAMFGPRFADIWPRTLAIAVAMFAVFFILYARAAVRDDLTEAAPDVPVVPGDEAGIATCALHETLPAGFPHILALSVEDHYVHVHGEDRREMVLMPLSEAAQNMPAESGKQVHRSWWVARSAVAGHKREGRDLKLVLTNGQSVPVSRRLVASLRTDGWID